MESGSNEDASAKEWRILVVDDDVELGTLVRRCLEREGYRTAAASSGQKAIEFLDQVHVDLMLLDLKLGDMHGRDVVESLSRREQPTPFIVVTGHGDERAAVDMMKRGAIDYLMKDESLLSLLTTVVAQAKQRITERARLDAAEGELRLVQTAIQQANESAMIMDAAAPFPDNGIVYVNPAFTRLTGWGHQDVVGKHPSILHGPRTDGAEVRKIRTCFESGESYQGEVVYHRQNGEKFFVELRIAPVRNGNGEITHWVEMQRDVTQRKRIEEKLRVSQEQYRKIAATRKSLLDEMNLRVDANFSGLVSLVSLVEQSSASRDAFAEKVKAHLTTLATVHRLVASSGWQPVELKDLLTRLLPAERIEFMGPSLKIPPRQVGPLAMIISELDSNCRRHGARTKPDGTVSIRWIVEDESSSDDETKVHIDWVESGGPTVTEPDEDGLGLRLIRGFAQYDLSGTCRMNFEPAGLRCGLFVSIESMSQGDTPAIHRTSI